MTLASWVCAAVTVLSAAVSLGFSIQGGMRASDDSTVPARYALARSTALFVTAVIALFTSLVPFIAAVAIAMIMVQLLDAVVGITIRDTFKSIGPILMAAANIGVLIWMLVS